MHSVCMLNSPKSIFLLSVKNLGKSKRTGFVDLIVCNKVMCECMLGKCTNSGKIQEYIKSVFQEFADEDKVRFSEQVATDR